METTTGIEYRFCGQRVQIQTKTQDLASATGIVGQAQDVNQDSPNAQRNEGRWKENVRPWRLQIQHDEVRTSIVYQGGTLESVPGTVLAPEDKEQFSKDLPMTLISSAYRKQEHTQREVWKKKVERTGKGYHFYTILSPDNVESAF